MTHLISQVCLSVLGSYPGGATPVLLSSAVFWVSGVLMVIIQKPYNFGFAASHLVWCLMMGAPACVVLFTHAIPSSPHIPQSIIGGYRAVASALMLAIGLVSALYGPHNTIECGTTQRTIGTFNVHLGLDRRSLQNLGGIAEEVREVTGLDVLAVQVSAVLIGDDF